eukprot:g1876.t1
MLEYSNLNQLLPTSQDRMNTFHSLTASVNTVANPNTDTKLRGTNKAMTSLNISSNRLKAEGIEHIAKAIRENGFLVSANLLNNSISIEQARNLAAILDGHSTLKSLCGNMGDETELDLSGWDMGDDGAIMLAPEIIANVALVSVNALNNSIGAEQAHNLAAILKKHATLKSLCGNNGNETELDMSSRKMGVDGAIMLAPEVAANGALTSLNVASNFLEAEGAKDVAEAVKMNGTLTAITFGDKTVVTMTCMMTEVDFSGKLNSYEARIVTAFLPRAMVSVSILKNKIPVEQARALVEIMRSKDSLTSLCGLSGTETELNLSNEELGAGDAILIANDIRDTAALTSLNVSDNELCGIGKHGRGTFNPSGIAALADLIKKNGALKSLDISSISLGEVVLPKGWTEKEREEKLLPGKPVGVLALADAMKSNRALEELSMAGNGLLTKETGKILADMLSYNSGLKALNISGSWKGLEPSLRDGPGFAKELAVGIAANKKLLSLDISDNAICGIQEDGKNDFLGAKALADGISTHEALTKVNMRNNYDNTGADALALALSLNTTLTQLHDATTVSRQEEEEEEEEEEEVVVVLGVQAQLKQIAERLDAQEFQFIGWKERKCPVLKAVAPIVAELEEMEITLQTMLTTWHVTFFREQGVVLLSSLCDTSETLGRLIKVQMLWCSLEGVFTSSDIAKQLPLEAMEFWEIDTEWQKIMAQAASTRRVVKICANEILRKSLRTMFKNLEKCQKSLEGFLEQKRNKFPRFYFVSNPRLLRILSQGSNPTSMNAHYESVFDSIFQVVHDKRDKTIITTILGPGGKGAELVPFVNPIKAVGNVEEWLSVICREQQITMKDICRNCAADIVVAGREIKALRGFVDSYIAQFALLGIELLWTADCTAGLEKCKIRKSAMKEANGKCLKVLQELSSWSLQDLRSKPNRKKIETLITRQVHHRDVINDIYRQSPAKVSGPDDFEWRKQVRFAWRPDTGDGVNEDGAQVISVTDIDFHYEYEYLGVKERLAATPLTDRCYISIAQALSLRFGTAINGPAGAGKTETVKDMGRTLGIWVVVTNCTGRQNYLDCAKLFKGLCQGGLWGCFDDFSRIALPVLSVVAQYVLSILNAKKAAVEYFQFPGDSTDIPILPVCSFFMTINSSYAGRCELPENVKALFRGVMMVPDFQIIMKVKLCSVGYSEFVMLAKKFFVFYNTNKEQLSNQKHYDWGLRNILS